MGFFDKVGGFLSGSDRDVYGRLEIPGEGQIMLPPGTLKVWYCEWGQLPENEHLVPPADLDVRVGPLGGDWHDIVPPEGMDLVLGRGEQPSQEYVYVFTLLGTVEVAEGGPWAVWANATDEPGHLRFGR